jgi:glycosyltransferase involved in cell wall biosynthesis
MADAVQWLAENPDQRVKLGASARAYVVNNYNRNAVLGAFEANLEALAASTASDHSSQAPALSRQ